MKLPLGPHDTSANTYGTGDNSLLFQSTQSLHCESAIVPVSTDTWGYCLDLFQKLILVLFFFKTYNYIFCYLFELFCNSRDLAKLEKNV